ncbi:MAG: SDR family oxidoreductase [Candidatus Hodarchaeota archaeon]
MEGKEKWVLVTGSSTGLGRACTEYLSSNGFHVYAGARKEKDLADLNALDNVTAVKLDVTKDDDVEAVSSQIEASGTGLFGLVNNAGIALGGPLVDVTPEEMQQQFDVNFFGVHRVTRAMFPLIFKEKGRIIMMSSIAGRIANVITGPYCASKFGLEGYSDTLRRELLPYGVKVVIIEPGNYQTVIWDKGLEALERIDKREHAIEELATLLKEFGPESFKNSKRTGKDPLEVAEIIYQALTIEKPKLRYLANFSYWQMRLLRLMGEKFLDKAIMKEYKRLIAKMKSGNS